MHAASVHLAGVGNGKACYVAGHRSRLAGAGRRARYLCQKSSVRVRVGWVRRYEILAHERNMCSCALAWGGLSAERSGRLTKLARYTAVCGAGHRGLQTGASLSRVRLLCRLTHVSRWTCCAVGIVSLGVSGSSVQLGVASSASRGPSVVGLCEGRVSVTLGLEEMSQPPDLLQAAHRSCSTSSSRTNPLIQETLEVDNCSKYTQPEPNVV